MLRRGATGGGALAAGALVASLAPAENAIAAAAPEGTASLAQALQTEQLIVIAYRQVVASPVLKPPVRQQLQMMLGQELRHMALLAHVLGARGQSAPSPPSLAAAQRMLISKNVHWSLTHLTNQHDCLKLLVDVESLVENAYFEAIGSVADATLVRMCAEIMGCEAQHWTILSGLLNHRDPKKAVPYPFVEGA
ncbi:MAG TPA: ferritin-like domain-containing protein [Solirubrobacteraceae bacterium]|nr:ferritin-like domain-containing protein [Solirubrobacteraceae bacterium]